jgi:hypothetical protein
VTGGHYARARRPDKRKEVAGAQQQLPGIESGGQCNHTSRITAVQSTLLVGWNSGHNGGHYPLYCDPGMARKLIRRYLPNPTAIRNNPALQFLGELLHDPNLFHLNRHSVSVAFFVGIFVAFIPIPMQMAVAAVFALVLRCNLPISVALVWISNPLTMPAMFFATYQFGRWILQAPPVTVSLELSWSWLVNEFSLIWMPLLTGSLVSGLIFGGVGYVTMQVFWRWQVTKNWERRKKRRVRNDSAEQKKDQDQNS